MMIAGGAFAQTAAAAADAPDQAGSGATAQIEEVVVTATRQSQALSRVPISVTAYTQARMDAQGVKQIDDIVRLTPGITFTPGRLRSNISIRGISSTAGAATTGIYIDDTPVQVRTLGTSSQNVYPTVFDLERVEVLRGPQGTLFGAGSEGGTIRFIQPQPSLSSYSGYARSEVATTDGGGLSYEAGVAVGGPIIQDKLGFRVSAFFRRDGGWIDAETGSFQVLDSTGKSGINSVLWKPTGVYSDNTNWTNTTAFRLALAWAPTDKIVITPSVFYQSAYTHDNIYDIYPAASDYGSSKFVSPQNIPTVDANHIALPNTYLNQPAYNQMVLPAIHVDWDLGWAKLVSNSSAFYRYSTIQPDYTQTYEVTYARRQVPVAGDFAVSPAENRQLGGTQEIRLQSPDPDAKLNWLVGGYYSKQRQGAIQNSKVNFVSLVPSIANATVAGYPTPLPAVTNGAPFGPGYSAYINYYGMDLLNGVTSYFAHLVSHDEQIAGFGQADYKVTDKLKVTAGVRVSKNKVDIYPDYNGPNSNLNTPRGYACVPGTGSPGAPACIPVGIGQYKPGEGPFALAFVQDPAFGSESSVTPKFSISYQADPRNLFYATASKGFRPGGAQQRQPSTCNDQLVALGYVDENGKPVSPTLYKSDSVWSYEVGAKNRLLGGKLTLDSSAYYIDWKNIQTSVSLSACIQSFFDNLGGATSKGFDVQAQYQALDNLLIGLAVGYNKTAFKDDTILGGRRLFSEGSAIPGSGAPWTVTLSAQYDFRAPFGVDAYVRGDYTYTSEYDRTGSTDPLSVSYDAYVQPRPQTSLLNTRAGVRLGEADVSLFVNNLTNEHPHLGLTRSSGQPIYTDYTFRPRTIGITASYRY